MTVVSGTVGPARPLGLPSGLVIWAPSVFVWGVWTSMLLATLAFVGKYGSNVPFWDDWEMIPALTGEQPITARWLWRPYHEHRIVLPKLILVALGTLTGCDFRAGMFLNACALAALACALILAAKSLRGWTSYTDAFFPLALLHWGHWPNLLWFFTVHFTSTTILAGALLSIVVRRRDPLTPGAAILAGVCLLLLPLTGAVGLPFVPPFALWFGVLGLGRWHSPGPHGRRDGLLILILASVPLLLVGLYLVRFASHVRGFPHAGLRASLRTGVQFLSTGLGPIAKPSWPFSGLVVIGLVLFSAVITATVWLQRPQERPRALGLLSFLGSMAVLALGLGWARALIVPDRGFSPHHVTLAALALCCIYFMWGILSTPRHHLVQAGLFGLMCILFPFNLREGLEEGRSRRERMEAFERDLRAKEPPFLLAERHIAFLLPYHPKEYFAARLRMLRSAGVGPYRSLPDDPASCEIPLPVVPTDPGRMDRGDWIVHESRDHSLLSFTLPRPRFVYNILLKYSSRDAGAAIPDIRISWERSDRKDGRVFLGKVHNFNSGYSGGGLGGGEVRLPLERGPGEKLLTVRVYDKLDNIKIVTNNVSFAKVLELVLLVPVGEM
jgi:hypothetical protein